MKVTCIKATSNKSGITKHFTPSHQVIGNGRSRNALVLCSVSVLVHIPGDPQSVQLRNATATTPNHQIDEK